MSDSLKKKTKSKTLPTARKNSGYDNSLRHEKSLANQKLIIETMVQLLVEKKGGEVTFGEVAKRTGLAERSIYRFFKDKEALYAETNRYLTGYLAEATKQINTMNVVGFGRNSYSILDRHEPLVLAYIYSQFGEETRRIFRKSLNLFLIEKIKVEKGLQDLTTEQMKKLALIVSLINAKIWHDIKSDFGFTGEQMGDAVEWALKTLIDSL